MRNVALIAGRDLNAYLFGFMGYLIIAAVLLIDGFGFNVFAVGSSPKLSAEVIRDFFWWCSGTTMIAGVLLSMPTFAGERLRGTDALLANAPVKVWEVVIGKYVAAMGVLGAMTLFTFYMPLLVLWNGKVAFAHLATGYLGLMMLGGAVVAIGTFASAFVPNHLVSAILSGVTVVFLLICWLLSQIVDAPLTDIVAYMALFDKHFIPFQEGRLLLTGLVYYLTIVGLFLYLTVKALEAEMSGKSGFFGFIYDLPIVIVGFGWLTGWLAVFLGQRVAYDMFLEWPFTILGVIILGIVVAYRGMEFAQEKDPGRHSALRTWMAGVAVGAVAFVLYLSTLPMVTDMLGMDEDAAARWYGAMTSIYLILWLLGTLPILFADRALFKHPKVMPARDARRAIHSGIATALVISLAFPVNYLANHNQIEYDTAYFRTTRAGTSTLALVRSLPEPVHATLFFTAGNDVKEQVVPYMRTLAEASGGQFTWEVVDQALVPEQAEELKVRDNGYIALAQGENIEKFKVGTDIDRARRDLKKLDSTVQKHLLKLAKGQRTAYMLTGHGEASAKEKENPTRKLNLFKKLLQSQNYKVEEFGVSEGSSDAVPEDAGLVVIAAPSRDLMPEEEIALQEYMERGGRMLLLTDPNPRPRDGESPTASAGVLANLGLTATQLPLAHKTKFVNQRQGKFDRIFLYSNRFGSHASVKTLSRRSAQLNVLLPTVSGIEKLPEQRGKVTTLIRSHPDTWADADTDFEKDAEEQAKVWDLAVAVEGGEGEQEWRAIVIGDVSLFSDSVLQFSEGNAVMALDSVRWLVGDEEIAGEVESEEDVRIQHTREEDVLWFWGTTLLMPFLFLLGGLGIVVYRRR